MAYATVTYRLDGQKRTTRIPTQTDEAAARARILDRFPKAEIIETRIHGEVPVVPDQSPAAISVPNPNEALVTKLNVATGEPPIVIEAEHEPTAAAIEKTSAPVEHANATNTKFTANEQPQPHAEAPAQPDTAVDAPAHATADLGKTPVAPHLGRVSAARMAPLPLVHPPSPEPHRVVPPLTGTTESDAAIRSLLPQLGDSVRVDVDKVPYMQRGPVHHQMVNRGLHGSVGVIVGARIEGGMYQFQIETGAVRDWVDAKCVTPDSLPEQPPMMQDKSRKSPEKMRKPSNGAYNLT